METEMEMETMETTGNGLFRNLLNSHYFSPRCHKQLKNMPETGITWKCSSYWLLRWPKDTYTLLRPNI